MKIIFVIGIHPCGIAGGIASAFEQPADAAINEMIMRATIWVM
jgi:hypothetical protein